MTSPTTPQPEAGSTPDAIAWRMLNVERALDKVVDKLDTLASSFVTHKDLEDTKAQAKEEHAAITKKIDETKLELEQDIAQVSGEVKALNRKRWIQNTLSAILGAILTLLISYAFLDLLGR
jgi:hypothetical protein